MTGRDETLGILPIPLPYLLPQMLDHLRGNGGFPQDRHGYIVTGLAKLSIAFASQPVLKMDGLLN